MISGRCSTVEQSFIPYMTTAMQYALRPEFWISMNNIIEYKYLLTDVTYRILSCQAAKLLTGSIRKFGNSEI
jgi:hypothetical protein